MMGPVRYLHQGLAATFEDITVNYPSRPKPIVCAGFPKGNWDLSDVDKIVMVRGVLSAGSAGEGTSALLTKEEGS